MSLSRGFSVLFFPITQKGFSEPNYKGDFAWPLKPASMSNESDLPIRREDSGCKRFIGHTPTIIFERLEKLFVVHIGLTQKRSGASHASAFRVLLVTARMNNRSPVDSDSTLKKPRLSYRERAALLSRYTRRVTYAAPVDRTAFSISFSHSRRPAPIPRASGEIIILPMCTAPCSATQN